MTLSPGRMVGLYEDDSAEIPVHASLTYEDVQASGPPAQPLTFPKPTIHRAFRVSGRAMDHRHGKVYDVLAISRTDKRIAYLFKKTIAKTTYGGVELCVVLRRRSHNKFKYYGSEADWISTDEMVAVKVSSWSKMRQHRGHHHLEDPLKEAAALQYIGNYHPHILGCLEVLQDDECLYTVMPYCTGGDMYSMIRKGSYRSGIRTRSQPPPPQQPSSNLNRTGSEKSIATTVTIHSNSSANTSRPNERQARVWFRQLLDALLHLQRKGVCHNDLRMDNLVLEANNDLVLVDFGLALRVPYADNSNLGGVSDVSEGTNRLLIKAQGRSGNLTYLAPEIIEGDAAFDGFAADVWSSGVILFVLLVGLAPFKWPNSTDVRYAQIKRGKLKELMEAHLPDNTVSDEACDLLQNMLWRDPRRRLTLAQILQHPWVVGPSDEDETTTEEESESRLEKEETTSSSSQAAAIPKNSPSPASNNTVHFEERVSAANLSSFFHQLS